MKTKTRKVLPKTASQIQNGGLYLQQVRCGKVACKCARGEPHTAFYFFTRQNGKITKVYVRKAEIEAFTAIANQSAFERQKRREAIKTSDEMLRNFRLDLLQNDGLIKTLKEDQSI